MQTQAKIGGFYTILEETGYLLPGFGTG